MSQQYWGHQQRQKLAFNNQAVLPRSGRVFSNPGFDQNTVWDSGKCKISWQDSGFDCSPGSGICQN